MKITIYELLRLIKDGRAPEKIKYNNVPLIYNEDARDYFYYCNKFLFEYLFANCGEFLNDYVEIIGDPKKIEKIKSNGDEFYSDYIEVWISKNKTDAYCEFLMNKINEIIDKVNNLK